MAKVARRTQEERRTSTIRKLLDAATEALIEVGWAGASVQEICKRAEVSQGGLFRHFPSREALMVAVGEDVGEKILVEYRRRFETLKSKEAPATLALRLVRDACRSRLNQAWYELSLAARTSKKLAKALAPTAERYHAAIEQLARELVPEVALRMGPRFGLLVSTIIATFDGESLHRMVLGARPQENDRIDLLAEMLGFAA